jgi:hypothetical protein
MFTTLAAVGSPRRRLCGIEKRQAPDGTPEAAARLEPVLTTVRSSYGIRHEQRPVLLTWLVMSGLPSNHCRERPARRLRRGRRIGTAIAALALVGCAQLGVPDVPAELGEPPWHPDGVYVAYLADTVVGFGHTAVLVRGHSGGWIRFEQLASAEVRYGSRLRDSTARGWETVTARMPSILGLTREVVVRLEGESPASLRYAGEQLLPIPGLDAAAVREAAERRWAAAPALEAPTAPRYWWMFNNSHHFTRDILSAGGEIHDRYFPKHFIQAYLDGVAADTERDRGRAESVRPSSAGPAAAS